MRYSVGFDHGNPYYRDKENDNEYWLSDDEPYNYLEPRPCARCGREVAWDEPDPCIGHIPGGIAGACCGHGVSDPYVFTNSGITSTCDGLYSGFHYILNETGYFDAANKQRTSRMFRLDETRWCPQAPIAILPMDPVEFIPRRTTYANTSLEAEIKNISVELGINSGNMARLYLPNREDAISIIAAYNAFSFDTGTFWTREFRANVPLAADSWQGMGWAAHMEPLNIIPIIELYGDYKDIYDSVIAEIDMFLFKRLIHEKDKRYLMDGDSLS